VIGFTHREVAAVMIGELALLTILAIPAGLWIGTQLANFIVTAASTETIRLPLILSTRSYVSAVLVVLTSATVSFAVVARNIHQLDLLSVLKARE
jgi:putative ABC transport system permease protein